MSSSRIFASQLETFAAQLLGSGSSSAAAAVASNQQRTVMVYGVTGYTGELVVKKLISCEQGRALLSSGVFVLAGRSAEKVNNVVRSVGWSPVVYGKTQPTEKCATVTSFTLDNDTSAIEQQLRDHRVSVLLNCAGPFAHTARPFIQACIAAGASYLDITGEYDIFEYVHDGKSLDSDAIAKKDLVIMPGVGYDVVPTDCMISLLAQEFRKRYPNEEPHEIKVAMAMLGKSGASHGTMKTVVAGMGQGIMSRVDGRLVPMPLGHSVEEFNFPYTSHRPHRLCCSIPWGDISTGYYSSGRVPNIRIYLADAAPPAWLVFLLSFTLVQMIQSVIFSIPFVVPLLQKLIEVLLPRGPTDEQRLTDKVSLVGYVSNKNGDKMLKAVGKTSNGYTLTAEASIVSALRVLVGDVQKYGCVTPSMCFGNNFINDFDDCEVKLE